MESLFRLESQSNTGSIELRQWNYAKDGLLQNVEKIEQYYQDYPIPVNGSHLLARLILSISVSRKLSFDRYLANCSALAMSTAQTLRMTSALSKGQLWDGVFYGAGTKEIILAHDTLFPIFEAHENWKTLRPVTVLLHNQSNTSMLLPDGRVNSTDKGVAIVAVNIPMLMAMYYRFNEEQDIVERNGGTRRTLYQFISSYALTGMLRTHLDQAYFNQLYNKVSGVPNTQAIRKHSFFLTDYSPALDAITTQQTEYLKNMEKRFSGVMHAAHMPFSGDLWELSKMPIIPSTLQVYWALTLSRIKVIAFLCLVQKDYERINKKELSTIRTLMRFQETRKVIKANLGMEAYYQVAPWLDIVGIE